MSKRGEYVVIAEGTDSIPMLSALDGVRIKDTPIPPRWHRCWPQTKGISSNFDQLEACACGAVRFTGRPWIKRNTRRKRQTTPM